MAEVSQSSKAAQLSTFICTSLSTFSSTPTPADAATMAAQAAPYAALTGGAAHRIATARTVLQDHYQRCPRGQQGDCVMVTAMPMREHVGGGWDFAWVGEYVSRQGRTVPIPAT
jgi:hypothetical protein